MGHEEAIKAIRAQGGTDADVEAYLRSVGAVQVSGAPSGPSERERLARAKAREATNAAEREALNTPATTVMNFLDAGTFGLAGLAQDALSRGSFKANRDARRMIYESIPTGERVALGVAGALANPVKRLLPAPAEGAGLLATAGRSAAEGAAQGAAQAFGENVGTTEGGLRPAATGAVAGGLLGGTLGAGATAAGRVGEKLGIAARVFRAKPVDTAAHEFNDAMTRIDDLLYGAARHEAQKVVSAPNIESVLESKTVKPFARLVAKSERYGSLTAPEQLMETYKLMSEAQRKAAGAIEGSPKFLAKNDIKVQDIKVAKRRMLEAAGEDVPSLRPAIETHAKMSGIADAANRTGDAITDILGGKSARGDKLTLGVDGGRIHSKESLRRAIAQMSPDEASAALESALGRGREVIRLTSNPVSQFGVRPSIFHAIRTPFQIDEFIKALEKQAGKPPTKLGEVFPELAARAPGVGGRIAGGLLSP